MVKILFCDIDGTLTDGTVFYSERGEEFKQFSHRDGRAFHLLKHKSKVKVFLITSETGGINAARAAKFQKLGTIAGFVGGKETKQDIVRKIAKQENVDLSECAFFGDDTNDLDAMLACGYMGCPGDANQIIKELEDICVTDALGGRGAVREYVDWLFLTEKIHGNSLNGGGNEDQTNT